MDLSLAARIVALFGLFLLILAGVLLLVDRLDLPLGDLPGDIQIRTKSFTCAVPIVSSLLISIFLTILLNVILYLSNR